MPDETATKGRVRELRDLLQTKVARIEEIAASFKDETGDGKFVVPAEQAADYRQAVKDATEIKGLLEAAEQHAGLRDYMDAPAGVPQAGVDATDAARHAGYESKSLAQVWRKSPAFEDMRESGFRRFGQVATFERSLHTFESKDVYTDRFGTITINTIGTPQNLGLQPRQLRPGRVRDLFPADTTSANMLFGVRETGYINRADVVPERRAADEVSPPTGGPTDVFGRKPRSEIDLTPVTYPIATIAHIMYVHRNVLEDEPRMRALLDRDMVDGVKMREDTEILYGDGQGDHLTGLVNTPGVQTYVGLDEKKSAQVRRAATRAILAYYQPTGVACHPFDWEDLELETDANGAYTIAVSVAVGGEKRLWRLNLVDTPAIMQGQFVLGAYGLAAKLWDREQVSIQVSTENRDMFERNVVTLRCEERVGLEVPRPEAMVIGTFTTPTTPP